MGEKGARHADGYRRLNDDCGAGACIRSHHGDSGKQVGSVHGVVFVKVGRDSDEIVRTPCQLCDIGRKSDFLERFEVRCDEVQTGLRYIEANGCENASEPLEEFLADIADANDADDDILIF